MAIETFEPLSGIKNLLHGFVLRDPVVDVSADRAEVLARLLPSHTAELEALGIDHTELWTAEQVHGCGIAICGAENPDHHQPAVDGLMTSDPGQYLGIYVADCCAVFVVDVERRACALLHAGKNGTELEIVPQAIELMQAEYGSRPQDLIVQLSPCIRPPWYEVDFAKKLREQCRAAGLSEENINDGGRCTAEKIDRYYSYRREKGKTGRMLAVLGWRLEESTADG